MVKRKVLQRTVSVTRESAGWVACWSDEPDGPRTQVRGRNLPGLDRAVRQTVAGDARVAPEVDITYEYHLGHARLDVATAQVRQSRAELAVAEATLAGRTLAIARELVSGEGMSYRDAATLLGVAHQWIAKLVAEGTDG
jgi:hypothetical protein